MKNRYWVLLCLILLEAILTSSAWCYSVQIARMHSEAVELHRASTALSANFPNSDRIHREEAESLDSKAWALIEEGARLRAIKLLWQAFSLVNLAALLGVGICFLRRNAADERKRVEAETRLLQEQASLEQTVQSRTSQLRAEVEERGRAEDRNRRQKRVLELLANGASLEEMFQELTASVAKQRQSWEAAVHLVDVQNRELKLAATSRVSDWLEHYLQTIVIDFPDAPETAALKSGEPHFVVSTVDQRRPWSEFLASNGIRSAWSLPLRAGDGAIAGTLTVYSRLFGAPTEDDRELLDSAVRLATLVVDVHRMNRELNRKAFEDELTGVANRRAGENKLRESILRNRHTGESFAVLWIDLDRFKRLNDLYGHSYGDQVLLESARRIDTHPRVKGSVARMGGDEFLVLLEPCSSDAEAQAVAREISERICAPMEFGAGYATVGASIGVTMFPRDGETLEDLERFADAAMYQAKRGNLGACVFSPMLRKDTELRLAIEEGLRSALRPGHSEAEFHLCYQPILRSSGELVAFEALLRFTHRELGRISPEQFIPIAEESRLIHQIGRWVLREACQQIKLWEYAGLGPIRVGVNISAAQWGREDFVAEVEEMLREAGIGGMRLTLEMTESAVMQSPERVRQHMSQLKGMGVRLAIDDFGTGYSSLSHLHQLPLDVLKIDRSFTARLGQKDDNSRAIVESVLSMAHMLGIMTIAEGVETSSQRDQLVRMGCDAMQGYLFSRPLVAETAADFVKQMNAARAASQASREKVVSLLPAQVLGTVTA